MNIESKPSADLIHFLAAKQYDFSMDESVLDLHSKDASVFVVPPSIIVYPRNDVEIRALVRKVGEIDAEHRKNASGKKSKLESFFEFLNLGTPKLNQAAITLSTRAGGTCMSGGSLSTGLILNLTKYMNAFKVDYENKTALVEMGVMYRDLETEMNTRNLFFAGYTSSKDICGIGGMIGNNSSGEKSLLYGATIENVESVKVVLADGNLYSFGPIRPEEFVAKRERDDAEGLIYRRIGEILKEYSFEIHGLKHPVPKCSSGYRIEKIYNKDTGEFNIAPLFVGSQSTLGIVTEAKIRLHESRKAHALLAIPVESLGDLPKILGLTMSYGPESVETFDINTLNSAQKFKPNEAGIARTFFKQNTELIILAEFAGDTIEQVNALAEIVRQQLAVSSTASPAHVEDVLTYKSLWAIRRFSFGAMRDDADGTHHAVPCIEDIIVPIQKFDVFIPELISILKERGIKYGFHGHIGDGALRVIPIFDMSRPDVVDRIADLSKAVFGLVRKMGGNMSADHSDGIIRSPFLKAFYGARTYKLFMDIKKTFDPDNIWNPNKKVGGTVADIEKYIIRK